MKARIINTLVSTGSAARDFIREVCGSKSTPAPTVAETTRTAGATKVLESFRNQGRQRETDYILTGKRVIKAMDEQLRAYRSAGEQFADWVTRGSHVSVGGDDRRFTVIELWWDRQAIRVQDDEGYDYMIPFSLIGPWPRENDE